MTPTPSESPALFSTLRRVRNAYGIYLRAGEGLTRALREAKSVGYSIQEIAKAAECTEEEAEDLMELIDD